MSFSYFVIVILILFLIFVGIKLYKSNKPVDLSKNYLPGSNNVILLKAGKNRIAIQNLIRKYTKLSPDKCQKLMLNVPSTILANIDSSSAYIIKSDFEKFGASIEIKKDYN